MTDNHDQTGSLASAKDAVSHGLATVKEKAADAYDATKDRASAAYQSSREGLSTATHRASDGLDQNPLAALAGGIAVGAVLGALLPRSRRETELLGNVGRVIADRARSATAAAKQAGQEKLDELGVSSSAAKDKAASFVDVAKQVAGSAGAAATQAAREGGTGTGGATTSGTSGSSTSATPPTTGTGGTSVLGADDGGSENLYSGVRSSEGDANRD